MRAMRAILEHAAQAGFEITTHRRFAEAFPAADA
jgi:hypothetical protein